jgi:hypothetical protein
VNLDGNLALAKTRKGAWPRKDGQEYGRRLHEGGVGLAPNGKDEAVVLSMLHTLVSKSYKWLLLSASNHSSEELWTCILIVQLNKYDNYSSRFCNLHSFI